MTSMNNAVLGWPVDEFGVVFGIPDPSGELWPHRCVATVHAATGKVERILFREIFNEATGCAQILAKHYDGEIGRRITIAFLHAIMTESAEENVPWAGQLTDICLELLPTLKGAAEITDRSRKHVRNVVEKILLALDSR